MTRWPRPAALHTSLVLAHQYVGQLRREMAEAIDTAPAMYERVVASHAVMLGGFRPASSARKPKVGS